MTAPEGVVHLAQFILDGLDLARHEWFGLFIAVAELAAQRIAAHQLLEATQAYRGRADIAAPLPCRAREAGRVDIDQLDDPVGIGPTRGDEQLGRDRPGNRHILFQHGALVHQHVGPRGGKALVRHHVFARHAQRRVADVRHRARRVGHVFIETGARGRGRGRLLPAQRAIGAEVQRARLRRFRRPGVVLAPDIRPRLEHGHRRQRGARLDALQVLLEERKLDLAPEPFACLCVELDVAKPGAVAARPAAVHPRAHHEGMVAALVLRFQRAVHDERAGGVFRIEPAAHRQHGRLDVLQVRANGALFPEAVIGIVLDVRHEQLALRVGHGRGDIRQCAVLQKIIVAVGHAVIEFAAGLRQRGRVRRRREGRIKVEVGGQLERAAVVRIVAHVQVGNRRLG